jgi:hypothetical protein
MCVVCYTQCEKFGILHNANAPGPDFITRLYAQSAANKRRALGANRRADFEQKFHIKVGGT